MMGIPMGACHVVDVPFVFGLVDSPMGQMFTGGGDDALALEKQVMDVWGAFARGDLVQACDWPGWDQQRLAKAFGPGDLVPLIDEEGEALWRSIMVPEGR
jgi:para-nitrobenzyl esterase